MPGNNIEETGKYDTGISKGTMKNQNYWSKLKPSKSIFRRKLLNVVMKNVSSKTMGQYHTKNLKFCLRKLCFYIY